MNKSTIIILKTLILLIAIIIAGPLLFFEFLEDDTVLMNTLLYNVIPLILVIVTYKIFQKFIYKKI